MFFHRCSSKKTAHKRKMYHSSLFIIIALVPVLLLACSSTLCNAAYQIIDLSTYSQSSFVYPTSLNFTADPRLTRGTQLQIAGLKVKEIVVDGLYNANSLRFTNCVIGALWFQRSIVDDSLLQVDNSQIGRFRSIDLDCVSGQWCYTGNWINDSVIEIRNNKFFDIPPEYTP